MRRVVIEPDAQLELRAAAQWYSEQEPGLFIHHDEVVHVFAVAHRGRKPGYWLKRTR